jgi:hypothetical protein
MYIMTVLFLIPTNSTSPYLIDPPIMSNIHSRVSSLGRPKFWLKIANLTIYVRTYYICIFINLTDHLFIFIHST